VVLRSYLIDAASTLSSAETDLTSFTKVRSQEMQAVSCEDYELITTCHSHLVKVPLHGVLAQHDSRGSSRVDSCAGRSDV
jgi:hypothetical protein